jgi:hypothetical protein
MTIYSFSSKIENDVSNFGVDAWLSRAVARQDPAAPNKKENK